MLTMYHGTRRSEFPRHEGLCLAETAAVAREYGIGSASDDEGVTVYRVTLDDDALSWEHLGAWDRDNAIAPGDTAKSRAALVAEHGVCSVWYTDETPRGRAHETLRLLNAEALDAIVSVEIVD